MAAPVLIAFPLALPVGWSAPAHHHPHPELLLVEAGAMQVETAQGGRLLRAGELALYPPGLRHAERNAAARPLALLCLHAGLAAPAGPWLSDASGRLAQLLRWLAEDRAAGAPAAVLEAWLAALRAQLARLRADAPAPLAPGILAAMRADPAARHDLAGLARRVGLGPRQLLRRYRAETGSTPLADLRRLRCQAAAGLLASTAWPLARIARAAGFCDEFHLSRAFRAHYGLPPGRMRRSRGGSAVE